MENSKFWNPKKNYFVFFLPAMAHKSIYWIDGIFFHQDFSYFNSLTSGHPINNQ